jgi:diacylglycerol O-acyltransferase
MEHMSPLDAAFLQLEDEDMHASLAIASVAVLEGPAPSQAEILDSLRGRLPLVPRYRQKARELPLDLGQPVWVDDPSFDLTYHVRRTALPVPGDDAALCRLVSRVMSARLDRDRPLWETWIIEGLADGRWAVLSKVHHCMADGISGNELYRLMFDESPEPGAGVADTWRPGPEPSSLQLLAGALAGLVRNPVDQIWAAANSLRRPGDVARRLAETVRGLVALAGVLVPVSRSSLAGPIGQQRQYGIARARLHDVIRVAKTFDVTVNDVVLAAVSGALRTVLIEDGVEPGANTIRTLVPVSVRPTAALANMGNRISLMLPLLPVEYSDPVRRLREVRRRLREAKASKEAEAGEMATMVAALEPFPPVSLMVRFASHLPHRNIVTVTTNVPASRRPLYILGRRITEILPYVPIAVRLRTGIAVLTYDDHMSFGITSDLGHGPDARALARAVGTEIDALVAAAAHADTARETPTRRSAPTKARRAELPAKRDRTAHADRAQGAPAKRAQPRKVTPSQAPAMSTASTRAGTRFTPPERSVRSSPLSPRMSGETLAPPSTSPPRSGRDHLTSPR